MRALLSLVSAAGVTGVFVLDGQGDALLRAAFVTGVWGSASFLAFLALAFLAQACGLDVEGAVAKAPPESSDGHLNH